MLKRVVLIVMVAALLVEMPVLAAEECGVKIDTKEAATECALKSGPVKQANERIEEVVSNDSRTVSAEEQKKMKEDTKEGNDLLDELIKQ